MYIGKKKIGITLKKRKRVSERRATDKMLMQDSKY